MTALVIEVEKLTKRFKNFTPVDEVALRVKQGEVYGFLGPNGAGKTTTIRMLLGLITPTAGDIRIFGKPLARNRIEIARQVGSLVESPSYYGHLTGWENLEVSRRLLGADTKQIDRVLAIVRLTEWKNKKVKTYSLGMKQRLGIAQALLGNPRLLILDEPTNGLDPAGIHEIRDLIISLPEQMDMTVLVSSHILQEVERIADRVGIIYQGRMLFEGELSELQARSKQELCIMAEPSGAAQAFLESCGYRVKPDGSRLYVEADRYQAAQINRNLIEHGYEVAHLAEEQESLEEIFLAMTKGAESR